MRVRAPLAFSRELLLAGEAQFFSARLTSAVTVDGQRLDARTCKSQSLSHGETVVYIKLRAV